MIQENILIYITYNDQSNQSISQDTATEMNNSVNICCTIDLSNT